MLSLPPSSTPPRNPRKWKFTWEALAHMPILRLFLFNPEVNPSTHCFRLSVVLRPELSRLLLSWVEEGEVEEEVRVSVPVPRVLIDVGSPVDFVGREDHIEVKLILVLPVDHPIVADFLGELRSPKDEDEEEREKCTGLSLDSDLNLLRMEDVHFYCKSCSTKLTRNCLRNFVELPSVNWRESADNWFGACCCSFGGISEILVSEYVNSYACTQGTCLIDSASVIISENDMEGYIIQTGPTEKSGQFDHSHTSVSSTPGDHCDFELEKNKKDCPTSNTISPQHEDFEMNLSSTCSSVNDSTSYQGSVKAHIFPSCALQEEVSRKDIDAKASEKSIYHSSSCNAFPTVKPSLDATKGNTLSSVYATAVSHFTVNDDQSDVGVKSDLYRSSELLFDEQLAPELAEMDLHHCCIIKRSDASKSSSGLECSESQKFDKSQNGCKSKKPSLIDSLGSGFMTKTSYMTDDVQWAEVLCRKCSSLLGSYPSSDDAGASLDGGVRLFKSYISSSIPINGTEDIFRKHTLEKVFTNLLLEKASDELSYQTIVRDVKSKSPMLKVIIVNSKVWCITGHCCENQAKEHDSSVILQPYVKVFYSNCCAETEERSRVLEGWNARDRTDEVYMMACQIKELTENLTLAQDRLPRSCSALQELSLSFMQRKSYELTMVQLYLKQSQDITRWRNIADRFVYYAV